MGKKLLILILIGVFVFISVTIVFTKPPGVDMNDQNHFEEKWEKVDSLQSKGLPKSALKIVKEIYQEAKKKKLAAQQIKALIYRAGLTASFEEEGLIKAIQEFERELKSSSFPVTPVLQSMLAELYWQYYQQNRYIILDRTVVREFQESDIRTWDARKFVEKVIQLHLAALKEAPKLQHIRINIFDDILNIEKSTRKFRPTLYDFLAHRAVDFFTNDESSLIRPAEQFQLRDPAYFQPAKDFAHLKLTTEDTLSFKFQGLKILQSLIQFHLDDKDPTALIDVDLKRLKFVYQNTTLVEKDNLYIRALEEMEQQYASYPISTWCAYERAQVYNRLANLYDPVKSQEHKWDRREAYKICMQAIQRFPKSDGASNCRALQTEIEKKELELNVENVNLPGKPFRALVTFRNVPRIYIRLIPETPEEAMELEREFEWDGDSREFQKKAKYYRNRRATAEWDVKLPDDGDYQTHRVEIKMPPLPKGRYIALVGTNPDFDTQNHAVAIQNLWVSQLGFVAVNIPGKPQNIYIFDRESGKPLPEVRVDLWEEKYSKKERRYVLSKRAQLMSDAHGKVSLKEQTENEYHRRYRLDLHYGEDRLFLKSEISGYYRPSRKQKEEWEKTFFFTDRSIYRPGQTVYFKGIIIHGEEGKNFIRKNKPTLVKLYDVNRQKVADLMLTTNEFGTFSGSFVLPTEVLTGIFSIRNESGAITFSVEEYKRPSFEVTFDAVSQSYRVNDTVTVSGKATTYSGANVDQAKVQYRVVRKAFFPYRRFWDWFYPFYEEEVEITNGVTTTDESGSFKISFTAKPDSRISPDKQPVFHYTVMADITDIGGETHSAQTVVNIGYVDLDVTMVLPETVNREKTLIIPITTENLNGEPTRAEGTISIYRLKEPGRILRKRFWEQPDTFLISREDYYRFFPHDVYDNEDDYRNWEPLEKSFETGFTSSGKVEVKVDGVQKFPEGFYRVELHTRDAFGQEVEMVKFFSLFSENEKTVPGQSLAWFTGLKTSGEPGETASFLWGSAAEKIHALLIETHPNGVVRTRWINGGKTKQHLTFPITEQDRGNFAFSVFFVKYGRVLQFGDDVMVPWSNKKLNIRYETFRDKLKPGQQEEWRLRISGPDGEKVVAEMLAAMYDASLDAFREHHWNFSIYPKHNYGYLRYSLLETPAFTTYTTYARGEYWNRQLPYQRRAYDSLNWFGFHFYETRLYSPMLMKMAATQSEDMMFDEAAKGSVLEEEGKTGEIPAEGAPESITEAPEPQIRKNLQETAFFFPHLQTDENGDVLIRFTIPEALTRWKFLGFAHTKDLKYALTETTAVTQKELMVVPHTPRFFREGDRIRFTARVMNLTEKNLEGTVTLQLFDALTMQPVDELFDHDGHEESFRVQGGQSAAVGWELEIPETVKAVTYRVVARTARFADGEENTLPILANRMLVTETLPLPLRGKGRKTFQFTHLLNSNSSKTLQHERLTLEFTANPAWYAIQALPYMMEFPYECSEQIFNRFYANSIASHIVDSKPVIRRVFEQWKKSDALLSNLEKNQELKALLLEETPWVLEAQDESARKKRIALLFDLNKMANEQRSALLKLSNMQSGDGGFPWFPEGPENTFITQYIVSGLGHLKKLGVMQIDYDLQVRQIVSNALAYIDQEMFEDYEELVNSKAKLEERHIGYEHIQYLYARSFFKEIPLESDDQVAFDYWKSQAEKYWTDFGLYLQGMIALSAHRYGDEKVTEEIIKSLKERALQSEEMGMYWKELSGGYYWYQAPIETQSLLIELFEEVSHDREAVDAMRLWLLKQKQTTDWHTTKATAEACYALLLRGQEWLSVTPEVKIRIGKEVVDPKKLDQVEA
ncbi:MAG: hypothetical protein D6748_03970, partial [Calditrichaeota bacterium]